MAVQVGSLLTLVSAGRVAVPQSRQVFTRASHTRLWQSSAVTCSSQHLYTQGQHLVSRSGPGQFQHEKPLRPLLSNNPLVTQRMHFSATNATNGKGNGNGSNDAKIGVPPSDPQLQFADLGDGQQVAYTDEGPQETGESANKQVVVLLHGAPGSNRDFRYLASPLEKSFRVIRLELPGHGSTPLLHPGSRKQGLTVEETSEFISRALSVILKGNGLNAGSKEATNIFLIGHSLGGPMAIETAVRDPRVKGVALINSVCVTPHRGLGPLPIAHFNAQIIKSGNPILTAPLKPIARGVFRTLGFSEHVTAEEYFTTIVRISNLNFDRLRDNAEQLRKMNTPTLMAWSTDDPLIQVHIFEELASILRGLGPQLCYNTGGHNLQKFKAKELSGEIAKWIESAAADGEEHRKPSSKL